MYIAFWILSFVYKISLVMTTDKVYIATMKPSVSSVSTPHISGDITNLFDGDTTDWISVDERRFPLKFVIDLGGTIPVNTLKLSMLTECFCKLQFYNMDS